MQSTTVTVTLKNGLQHGRLGVIRITDLINDLNDPPCIKFNQQEDTMRTTDDVTTALTDEGLDIVAGGWLALVGAFAGRPSHPSRDIVLRLTGLNPDTDNTGNN